MATLIEAKLQQVFSDFQSEIAVAQKLCACKTLTYKGGNSPDYANHLVQQQYMLRYFPAYFVEYLLMYEKMLSLGFLPDALNVFSIGCGCGVDLWGLAHAFRRAGRDPISDISYTGIDRVKWKYTDKLGINQARFITADISTWQKMDKDDYNVFVFPKCIGEFPDDVFHAILKMFRNTTFTQDRLCGLCSLMEVGKEDDKERFQEIVQIMRGHKFKCRDNVTAYYKPTKRQGLRKHETSFIIPDYICDYLDPLSEHCPTFIQNGVSCRSDCVEMDRSPILYNDYVSFQCLRFER